MEANYHIPVLLDTVIENLRLEPSGVVADVTCGEGGHSREIIKKIHKGWLICVDRDPEILKTARSRLSEFGNVSFYNETFDKIDGIIKEFEGSYPHGRATIENGIKVQAILADLGISMYHFRRGGFSYTDDSPLDMRLEPDNDVSADIIINRYPEEKIADILYQYGEEYDSRKIARAVCRERPVKSSRQLAAIVMRAKRQKPGKIHPATKTFQALRIFINKELKILESFIPHAVDNLSENGRLIIISYHSLEDRIVKNSFRELAAKGKGSIVNKKPIVPSEEEIRNNRASRSAKLRIFEKRSFNE